jgi:hypothetical protein
MIVRTAKAAEQGMESSMDVEPGDIAVGVMMSVFGLVGLTLAARALDDAMYVFGLSLAGFAFVFMLGLIRRHYDREQAAEPAGEILHAARPRLVSDV